MSALAPGREFPNARYGPARRSSSTRTGSNPLWCPDGQRSGLTDIFVMEDPEQPRSQIRSHLPEVKLPEHSRQALLDEVVGVDGIMRQTARISSKVGKYAFDIPVQQVFRGISLFIQAGRLSTPCPHHHLAACRF